ncbi:hypothetical protein SVAN01_03327 [Stagonosporopsis vannaccii]|nr:hypothetical protein SVAN01_03327 [Stagonosporopsis vannaccii]
MPPMFNLAGTIAQVFGNAPHLCLSIISHYQLSGSVTRTPAHRMASDHRSIKKLGGEPAPEPPAAPPSHSQTPKSPVSTGFEPAYFSHNPKPAPEPHPAPPVIILSHSERSSPPSSSGAPSPSSSRPRVPDGPVTRSRVHSKSRRTYTHREMGSKASKLSPKGGKLQSSQEKKDKEEMKEPTNYYTHRSKSMRRKAGKEASSDGAAGGVSMGSGGAGGAM